MAILDIIVAILFPVQLIIGSLAVFKSGSFLKESLTFKADNKDNNSAEQSAEFDQEAIEFDQEAAEIDRKSI